MRSTKLTALWAVFSAVIILGMTSVNAADDTAEKLFKEGNALYVQGKYDEAIAKYIEITANGQESGNLYYNLGNAFFKKGDIAGAIINYERARRLIPDDKELAANYDYAVQKIEENRPNVGPGIFRALMDNIFEALSTDILTIVAALLYWLIVILLITAMILTAARRTLITSAIVIAVVFCVVFSQLFYVISGYGKDSIVISGLQDVKYGPFSSATTYYQVREGDKVRIVSRSQGWSKVRRADGKTGWIEDSAIQVI